MKTIVLNFTCLNLYCGDFVFSPIGETYYAKFADGTIRMCRVKDIIIDPHYNSKIKTIFEVAQHEDISTNTKGVCLSKNLDELKGTNVSDTNNYMERIDFTQSVDIAAIIGRKYGIKVHFKTDYVGMPYAMVVNAYGEFGGTIKIVCLTMLITINGTDVDVTLPQIEGWEGYTKCYRTESAAKANFHPQNIGFDDEEVKEEETKLKVLVELTENEVETIKQLLPKIKIS